MMTGDEGVSDFAMVPQLMEAALGANDNALGDSTLRRELEKGFDIVVVSPFFASEAGYHLAHRSQAHLVLYYTCQASISFMDWAMGQPNTPAYMPFILIDFSPPFTFLQRVFNAVAGFGFHALR